MSSPESPRAYEREADASRVRLANSLDQLANSLTPGRVLDEVLTYAKGGGGQFLKGLGNAASANPIPSLLIGVGTALFLSGKAKLPLRNGATPSSAASYPRQGNAPYPREGKWESDEGGMLSSMAGAVKSAASTVGGAIGSAARGVSSSIQSGAGAVGEGAAGAASAVSDTAREGADRVADAAGYVGSAAAGAARAVGQGVSSAFGAAADAGMAVGSSALEEARVLGDQSRRLMHDARDVATRLASEQPLLVGAAGLAMGIAIAAMLPRSKLEDRWMGETSDAVKETVAGVASEQYQKAKDVTGRVAEEVKNVAAAEGISATAAADVVKDLGEKLRTVVSSVGEVGASADDGRQEHQANDASQFQRE